jgi:hypothetical protein
MLDDDEAGVGGGIRTGRGNRSAQRKPAPVPFLPTQIPHNLTWDRTWAAVAESYFDRLHLSCNSDKPHMVSVSTDQYSSSVYPNISDLNHMVPKENINFMMGLGGGATDYQVYA